MADVVRVHSRSLVLSTDKLGREGWVTRLINEMRRARRRKHEDFLRLYPKGACADTTMYPFYEEAVRHAGGLL